MVAPLQSDYSNRKGIYKDLYREIDSDNKKREAAQVRKPKKGIYIELYKQIEFKNNERKNEQSSLYSLAFKKFVKDVFSRIFYFFSVATSEIKMLIFACMVAKRPINSYIENNISD
ncbi:MAG: hypothetical protein WCY19_03435 [Candidatus Gastranaerophilaceae bacterium]